jgi:hypothetical protein
MVVVNGGVADYAKCGRTIENSRCIIHGGRMGVHAEGCQTVNVLADVRAERARQFARYGTNENFLDGTGPEVDWLGNVGGADDLTAVEIQEGLRKRYEAYEAEYGVVTFRHLVAEEVAEAFQESSPARLRAELLQVAALAVSWIEKIDARIPEWRDLDSTEAPQVGDVAFKKGTELDGREVTIVEGEWFWFHLTTSESGPYAVEDYTFRRRVR